MSHDIEYSRQWRRDNPDKVKVINARWYAANKESERVRSRQRYANLTPEQRADRKRADLNRYLIRTYGITLDERDALLAAQGGKCASCGSLTPNSEKGWHVDHDHETEEIRGILCQYCNCAIGQVQESIERLQSMIAYLSRHKGAQ